MKPEWQTEEQRVVRNAPVSYSRNETMRLQLGLRVWREGETAPSGVQGRIFGRPVHSSKQSFRFQSDEFLLTEERDQVVVVGEAPLPDWPRTLEKEIEWTFRGDHVKIDLGRSGPHTVFVTFGPPTGYQEDNQRTYVYGATHARMREATRRVAEIDSCSSVKLIKRLFRQLGDYGVGGFEQLSTWDELEVEGDTRLKAYMEKVDWPRFFPYINLRSPRAFSSSRRVYLDEWEASLARIVRRCRHLEGEIEDSRDVIRGLSRGLRDTLRSALEDVDDALVDAETMEQVDAHIDYYSDQASQEIEQERRFILEAEREAEDLNTLLQTEREKIRTEHRKQGGAWPLAVLEKYGGECQAIVRFVLAVLRQLGFRGESGRGSVEIRYVASEIRNRYFLEPIIGEAPVSCRGPRAGQGYRYGLVDRPVKRRSYAASELKHKRIRLKSFQTYLRYVYEDNGTPYQVWYGGGIGQVGDPQSCEGPLTPAFRHELLSKPFAGLIEYVSDGSEITVTNYWPFQ